MINAMNHQSKNKQIITVRLANILDAEALLALKLNYLENTSSIPLFVDEYKKTIEEEAELITRLTEEKNSCLLVAEIGGQLVGNIDLMGNQRRKLHHTGVIGMGIHTDWQGQGIGGFLMKDMLRWANENEYLQIIWLEVYANNKAGKKLYVNSGFKECGRMMDFFRENGRTIDNIRMVRYLSEK